MINPVWALLLLAAIGVLVKVRRKYRLFFRIATPTLAGTLIVGILFFALMHVWYWFDISVGKDGTVIVIRHGRMCGPICEIDVPPEFYAGNLMSPWFDDMGTSEAVEDNDYEGHRAEEYPVKLFWDSCNRFWVERYSSGAGIFVQRDSDGRWQVHCVNAGMHNVVHR